MRYQGDEINVDTSHSDHIEAPQNDAYEYSDEDDKNEYKNNDEVQNNLEYELEEL